MLDQNSEAHGNNVGNIQLEVESQPHDQNPPKSHESPAVTPNNHNVNPLGLDPNIMGQLLVELLKKASQQNNDVEENGSRLIERVAKQNPKTYNGKVDPVKLEDWIRSMEKIFEVVQVPENRKVSIGTFYLEGQADIWWNTVKEKQNEPDFNWGKFIDILRQKFYPRAVQRQKENEFMKLKQGDMSVLEYTEKFMELSRFAQEFVASEKLRKTRFEDGLADYIRDKLAGQNITTYQELYDRAADVERVVNELRGNNWRQNKRKIDDFENSNFSKRPTPNEGNPLPIEPCKNCGRNNHTTSECRKGSNLCFWCGSPEHRVTNCPRREKAVNQGKVQPLLAKQSVPPHASTSKGGRV